MSQQTQQTCWQFSSSTYLAMFGAVALAIFFFHEGLGYMVKTWGVQEEYSYGYMLPFIALFLIWQKKNYLESTAIQGAWFGTLLTVVGLAMFFLGELSTLYVVVQYAFVVVLVGLALALLGWRGFKLVWPAFALLIFMIPLPNFLYQGLSAKLQLLSSELGVSVIRAFGISVALEGNVIDLGSMQLQVVEACSGLRYLFPLMTLGFLAAYFYKGAMWKRVLLFFSTIPLTVLMNSFRIGMIGITVEYWGKSMAEGFLHDFEGWVVFMGCTAFLVGEMWLLAKIGKEKQSLRNVFALELPAPASNGAVVRQHAFSKPFIAAATALVVIGTLHVALPKRTEIIPQRTEFAQFPMSVGHWTGHGGVLDRIYIDILKFDDYIIADFTNEQLQSINFYVAYYGSQRKGESAHSPRSCIPGGGWEITSLTQRTIPGATVAGHPITVNRTVIEKGEEKQLVYYWFQQRGRVITNEYMVKWFLFWDALTRNRSDGALVRLTAYLKPGEDSEAADKRLADFTQAVAPRLPAFIPE